MNYLTPSECRLEMRIHAKLTNEGWLASADEMIAARPVADWCSWYLWSARRAARRRARMTRKRRRGWA